MITAIIITAITGTFLFAYSLCKAAKRADRFMEKRQLEKKFKK